MRRSGPSKTQITEAESRLAAAEAKIARHRRVMSTTVLLLLLAAILILVAVVGHISGVSWLSHRDQRLLV